MDTETTTAGHNNLARAADPLGATTLTIYLGLSAAAGGPTAYVHAGRRMVVTR